MRAPTITRIHDSIEDIDSRRQALKDELELLDANYMRIVRHIAEVRHQLADAEAELDARLEAEAL